MGGAGIGVDICGGLMRGAVGRAKARHLHNHSTLEGQADGPVFLGVGDGDGYGMGLGVVLPSLRNLLACAEFVWFVGDADDG